MSDTMNKGTREVRDFVSARGALGGALLGDRVQPLADLLGVGADVVEARQLERLPSPKTRSKSGVVR